MLLCNLRSIGIEWPNAYAWNYDALDIVSGKLYWLRGANGVGKSTLIRLLLGLLPNRCQISWQADSCVSMNMHASFCSMLSADNEPNDSVYSIVAQEYSLRTGLCPSEAFMQSLSSVLGGRLSRGLRWGDLSMGQKCQVRHLALSYTRSAIWLLDEPFVYLDHQASGQLIKYLKQHQAKGGAILLTSHIDISMAYEPIDLKRL